MSAKGELNSEEEVKQLEAFLQKKEKQIEELKQYIRRKKEQMGNLLFTGVG